MHCHTLTSSQPLPALPSPRHTHTHSLLSQLPGLFSRKLSYFMCHHPSSLGLSLIGWAPAAGNVNSHTAWNWLSRGHPRPEPRRLCDKAKTCHPELVTLLPAGLPTPPWGRGPPGDVDPASSQARSWTASNCREEGNHWNSCSSQQEDVSIRFWRFGESVPDTKPSLLTLKNKNYQ